MVVSFRVVSCRVVLWSAVVGLVGCVVFAFVVCCGVLWCVVLCYGVGWDVK